MPPSILAETHARSKIKIWGIAMQRRWAAIGSTVFFFVAPGTLAGLFPWSLTRWELRSALGDSRGLRAIGILLIVVGSAGLIDSFARFVMDGRGTPAPIAPPERLVVTGLYRYVRNPMYVCVVSAILGQALLLGDAGLLIYCAIVWLGFTLFVIVYEEPTLRSTFGASYAAYCRCVGRWVPRLTPWHE
jgi:protein-S-isoprenylcysteine O-methyltransferase Ste14